ASCRLRRPRHRARQCARPRRAGADRHVRDPAAGHRRIARDVRRRAARGRRMNGREELSTMMTRGPEPDGDAIVNVLPLPILTVAAEGLIIQANIAAESFFETGLTLLRRQSLLDLLPFGSPVIALVEEVRQRGASVSEYRVDIGSPRLGGSRIVDVFATPLSESSDRVVLMLQERTIAEKMDRQLTHRGAARSVTADPKSTR